MSGVKTFRVTDGADGGADGGVRQLRRLARSGSRRAGGGSRREGYPRSAPGRQTVGGGWGVRVVARHAQPPLRGVPGPCAPASAHLLCDARKGCGPLHAAHDGDVCARRGLLEPCGFVRGLELHEACAVVQSGLPAAAPRDHHALQPHARAAQRCAAAGHARREHARAAQLLPRRGHRAPRARGARRVLPPQQKSPSKQLDAWRGCSGVRQCEPSLPARRSRGLTTPWKHACGRVADNVMRTKAPAPVGRLSIYSRCGRARSSPPELGLQAVVLPVLHLLALRQPLLDLLLLLVAPVLGRVRVGRVLEEVRLEVPIGELWKSGPRA